MEKINFVNGQAPYINDTNLNQMQTNIENAVEGYQMLKQGSGESMRYCLMAEYNLVENYKDLSDVIIFNQDTTGQVGSAEIINVIFRKNLNNDGVISMLEYLNANHNKNLDFFLVNNYNNSTNTINIKLYVLTKGSYTKVYGRSLDYRCSEVGVTRTYYTDQPNITSLPSGTVVKAVGQELYSTDETMIGIWIDGKPLYRKVVDIGNLPNATYKNVAHGLTNFAIRKIYGMANYQQTYTPLPYVEIGAQVSYQIKINVSGSFININCDNNQSMYTGYVVLEYTKTKD